MILACPFCDREFDANNGLKIHLPLCDLKRTQVNTEILMERRDYTEVFHPLYQPDNTYPDTEWHNISGKQIFDFINRTYDDIIRWRKNLFKLPTGKAGRLFSNELTIWLDHYNRSKSIAFKIFMTLPCLLRQKPSRNSKAKDHSKTLEDRLKPWNEGKIDMLVKEARTIQNSFRNFTNTNVPKTIVLVHSQNQCGKVKHRRPLICYLKTTKMVYSK